MPVRVIQSGGRRLANPFQQLNQKAFRVLLPAVVIVFCLWALSQQVTLETLARVPEQIQLVQWYQWVLASCFTGVSFWAVGRYDAVAHCYFQTGVSPRRARRSGTIAIAFSQTMGLGLLTSAFARWRMLPGLGAATSFKLSAYVSGTYIITWMVIASAACLILPAPDWTFWPAMGGVLAGYCIVVLIFFKPKLRSPWFTIELPSLRLGLASLSFAIIDSVGAAAALYVLLPTGNGLSFAALLPLYLISLGAGLISNTPGGVGPFELMLLSVPDVSSEAILGAIVAFRIVYYALPALMAGLFLLRPFPSDRKSSLPRPTASLREAPRSDVGVIRQNGGKIVRLLDSQAAVWPTPQTLTLLAEPISGHPAAAIMGLRAAASRVGRWPLLYKCGARTAVYARLQDWRALHLSDDAIVNPQTFQPEKPMYRRLRQHLFEAKRAGVTIEACSASLVDTLSAVDARWPGVVGLYDLSAMLSVFRLLCGR